MSSLALHARAATRSLRPSCGTNDQPQEIVDAGTVVMPIRDDVTAYARSLAGLSADPSCPTRAAYLALIAPGETEARAASMATMSGCGLTQRAILRRFINHPILEALYRDRQAMSDLLAIATAAGAAYTSRRAVEPGDIVIVGGGSDGGGPEHTWMALDVEGDPYADVGHPCELITGLDGGHRDEKTGFQSIVHRDHELCRAVDEAAGLRRVVRWVFDVEKIAAKFGRA
jgi:hypothetical protein